MSSRAIAIVGAALLLAAACTTSAPSQPPPSQPATLPPSGSPPPTSSPPPSVPPSDNATPSAGTGTVILHGTFTGHTAGATSSADMTAQFDLQWNFGPDDIHDMNAFTFLSGSFTSAVSIAGVCGGSKSASGALTPTGGGSLSSGGLQDQDYARVVMVDQRLSPSVAVEFSAFSSYYVQGPDPAGCADSSKFGAGGCPMKFQWTAIGKLKEDATCSVEGTGIQWTGHLAP